MNLQSFNEMYLPIINFIISLSGLVTLILLIIQYKEDNNWRRLQSPYNFIGIGEEFKLQERLYKTYDRLGIYSFPEVCKPLTTDQVKLISNDLEATLITNTFLNHFQNLCTAYSFKLIDKAVFREIHYSRICWWHTVLEPYIDQRKIDYNNQGIWHEINEIVTKFSAG